MFSAIMVALIIVSIAVTVALVAGILVQAERIHRSDKAAQARNLEARAKIRARA